jgi:hypothetical protein
MIQYCIYYTKLHSILNFIRSQDNFQDYLTILGVHEIFKQISPRPGMGCWLPHFLRFAPRLEDMGHNTVTDSGSKFDRLLAVVVITLCTCMPRI